MATAIATVSSCIPANLINCHTNSKPKIPTTTSTRFQLRPSFSSAFPADLASSNFLNKKKKQKQKRGWGVVTRAGPSTTTVVLVFVFPLTLLLVTVLTSIRISDSLDQKFLEEVAINEAIMDEEDENGEDDLTSAKEMPTPALTRARNRPKRQA